MKECDQMARLFVQYLTLHKIRIFTKVGSIFCQAPTKKTSKDAQVVNFPQIWSQCHHYALLCSVLSFNNASICFETFINAHLSVILKHLMQASKCAQIMQNFTFRNALIA